MNAKTFALEQIKPYYKDNSLCGIENGKCSYLTTDGKMCVAGKNMIDPSKYKFSIHSILGNKEGQNIFKHESRNILTQNQWYALQNIHDCIANNKTPHELDERIMKLGLFTLAELKEQ